MHDILLFGLISAACIAILGLNYQAVERAVIAWTTGYAEWLHDELDRQFVEVTKAQCILMFVGGGTAGAVLGWLVYPSPLAALPLGAIGWLIPRLYVKRRAQKRRNAFGGQLVDSLVLLANSLRSGLSLLQSFHIVVSEMDAPISDELGLVLKEQRLSAQLDDALKHLNERMQSEDLDMVVTSILTLRETGGNLAETFDTVVYTIRERKKVEDKIKSLTAQGYLQGIMACFSPVAFVILMYVMQKQIVMPLLTTPAGWLMMAIAAALDIMGFFVLKKLVTIRV
ncbi:MAG: type II secretion system F family protein [Candidatus Schekmanbacteria bacterium]|nr:type II secretion system F family protein [Candidatus Schekmanbacteria bacterium]